MSWFDSPGWDSDGDESTWPPPAEFCAPDADAWRAEEDRAPSEASWRGDQHLGDWPEHQAGPEYRMLKDRLKQERW